MKLTSFSINSLTILQVSQLLFLKRTFLLKFHNMTAPKKEKTNKH